MTRRSRPGVLASRRGWLERQWDSGFSSERRELQALRIDTGTEARGGLAEKF